MTYVKCELMKRVLPVATFVLISFLLSGKLVRARPQETSTIDGSHFKEVTPEKTEPVTSATENDRYKSTLTQTEPSTNMYKFLQNHDSAVSWLLANREFLYRATNCLLVDEKPSTPKLAANAKLLKSYLRKIKTKIKINPWLRHLLRLSFRQINSKANQVGNHFKFLMFLFFVRLFTILRSCKHSSKSNQNRLDLLKPCRRLQNDQRDLLLYVERIIDAYVGSLGSLFETTPRCFLPPTKRTKRSNREAKKYVYAGYTVKNKFPVTVSEPNYVDNSYRETLIANFLKNSLPDLKIPYVVVEQGHKMISSTAKPYVVSLVDSVVLSKTRTPVRISSNVHSPSGEWNVQSTTQFYTVPLLTKLRPRPEAEPPTQITTESYVEWSQLSSSNDQYHSTTPSPHIVAETHTQWYKPSTHRPSISLSNKWYQYPPYPPYVPPSTTEDDLFLHFPDSPLSNISYIPPKHPNYDEPVFIEPIVVASVDHLPTNYPVPAENVSLGHNPMTVLIGSKPPEIFVFEDATIQSTVTIAEDEQSAGTTGGETTIPVAADPAAGAGSAGSGVGPAAAAAAAAGAAGLGAAGALGAAAGAAGAAAGGAGSAASAAASATFGGDIGGGGGGAADAGVDSEVAGSGTVDLQVRPTDAIAYSPEDESGLDPFFSSTYELISWIVSFGFLRSIMTALYTLVLPHVSFLLTSGFTVIAFLFPWLYPHIVVPLMSTLTSLSGRSNDVG